MTPNTYDFKGKAILCETWEQVEHLSALANGQRLPISINGLQFAAFTAGDNIFRYSNALGYWSNFSTTGGYDTISYADFLTVPDPVPSWQQIHASINC